MAISKSFVPLRKLFNASAACGSRLAAERLDVLQDNGMLLECPHGAKRTLGRPVEWRFDPRGHSRISKQFCGA
jgi:hypothetical protein